VPADFQNADNQIVVSKTCQTQEELKTVKADIKGLDVEGFIASVKFKVEGNELFEEPINIPGLKGKKYNRFQPYIIDEELEKIFEGYLPKNRFEFKPGVAKNTGDFEKNSAASTKTIVRLHSLEFDTSNFKKCIWMALRPFLLSIS
jgi:hypothetical protein